MDKTVKFAIIGCGRIAPRHAEAIKNIPGAELVAVCDISKNKAIEFAKKYNCRYYYDYNELLRKENDIDCINICTFHGIHAQITIDCANAHKHVVTEKPMAMNVKEAKEMIKVCKERGKKLFVVKQNRYNPAIKKLKKALDDGRFGKLFLGNATVRWTRPQSYYDQDPWRGTKAKDGGVLMNQASHHIDMLIWLLGRPKSVVGYCATMTHKIESEDTGIALIKFDNGAFGVIEATTCIFPKNLEGSISVFGVNGSAKVGGTAMNKIELWQFADKLEEDEKINSFSTNPPDVYGFGHLEYLKDVVIAIQKDLNPAIDGIEGLKSLEITEAIYESIKLGGKEIVFSND